MGHRLTKIATRTGDAGETGLGDGSRVPKDHPRVAALGEVDELNSVVGLVLAEEIPEEIRSALIAVQHDLLDLGGELSIPGHALLKSERVAFLDSEIEKQQAARRSRNSSFPAGARRAARTSRDRVPAGRKSVIALGRKETVGEPARQYLNRLSDLLFVAARVLNRAAGVEDVQWRHQRKR
jgi:cob(I)alamin adenosyltransferase